MYLGCFVDSVVARTLPYKLATTGGMFQEIYATCLHTEHHAFMVSVAIHKVVFEVDSILMF
jgi:hypothetical protein